MTWELQPQALITGLTNGLVISLVALGYTMVYGIVELINFAHGDLVMLGAFAALTIIGLLGLHGDGSWGSVVLLLATVPLFTAACNWGIERIAYRPLRSAPKLTSLVSAIGVSFILVNLGLFWGGVPMTVFGTSPASPKDVPELIGNGILVDLGTQTIPAAITAKDILVLAVTVPLMLLLTWFIRGTRMGTGMRAVAQDPTAARLMGIDVDRVISTTFVIGGLLAGVAAVVLLLVNNTVHFQMGFRVGLDAFTAAVLGGIGNLPGAVLGGICIGLVRAVMETCVDGGGQWVNTAVFVVLLGVLVFRPQGILGTRVREKV
jgi:branched-chain amino acid transport system permease protein